MRTWPSIHAVYQILLPVSTKSILLFALYITLFRLLLYTVLFIPVYITVGIFVFTCFFYVFLHCHSHWSLNVLCAFVTFHNKVWLIEFDLIENRADDIYSTVSVADQQRIFPWRLHEYRSSLFPLAPRFPLLRTMTWSCHVFGQCVMVRAVSVSWHPISGTRCHLNSISISREQFKSGFSI